MDERQFPRGSIYVWQGNSLIGLHFSGKGEMHRVAQYVAKQKLTPFGTHLSEILDGVAVGNIIDAADKFTRPPDEARQQMTPMDVQGQEWHCPNHNNVMKKSKHSPPNNPTYYCSVTGCKMRHNKWGYFEASS